MPNPRAARPTPLDHVLIAELSTDDLGVYRISLPIPDAQLSANGRLHWRAKAALVKKTRWWAYITAGIKRREPLFTGKVTVDLLYVHERGRVASDKDNLTIRAKAVFDGLTDARIWRDDRQIETITARETTAAAVGLKACLVVTVRAIHGVDVESVK